MSQRKWQQIDVADSELPQSINQLPKCCRCQDVVSEEEREHWKEQNAPPVWAETAGKMNEIVQQDKPEFGSITEKMIRPKHRWERKKQYLFGR